MKFDAVIALPEKRGTVDYVAIGGSIIDGIPNLQDPNNLKLFGVLNLIEPTKSTRLRYVDGLSRALIFEKGCTLGTKSILDEYLTTNNFNVALNYGHLVVLVILSFDVENGLYWLYWELIALEVVLMSLTVMHISLIIKAIGVLGMGHCFSLLVCLAVLVAIVFVGSCTKSEKRAKFFIKKQLKSPGSFRSTRKRDLLNRVNVV